MSVDLSDPPAGTARTEPAGGARTRRGRVLRTAALISLGLVVFVRLVALEPFVIPSASMSPTLRVGDRVLVGRLGYRLSVPRRGELVAFVSDYGGGPEVHIKRLVALPGDVVAMKRGTLSINGTVKREAYVNARPQDHTTYGPLTVPPGHYFVLGDNRALSTDSRSTGPVPEADLIGPVLWRVWPPSRARPL